MRCSIARVVKDLGKISIDNLISTEEPTNKNGLYSDEDFSDTDLFLYPTDDSHFVFQNEGGTYYAKKSNSTNP